VSQNRNKSKVSQKAGKSVSQKPASQPDVPWRLPLSGPVASSKEVQVCRKPKQVESQPVVETVSQSETSQSAGCALAVVSQSETSQSAGCALAVTIMWASGVLKESPSQPNTETSRK